MRIRTSLLIVFLVGAFVAVPLYIVTQPEQAAESPGTGNAAAPPAVGERNASDLYCAQRTPERGVMVRTEADCALRGESADPDFLTLTITREPDALVITGSDP